MQATRLYTVLLVSFLFSATADSSEAQAITYVPLYTFNDTASSVSRTGEVNADGIDDFIIGRNGQPFMHRSAICLECQRFPNSPNQADFPSAILRPGEVYEKTTVYRFSTQ